MAGTVIRSVITFDDGAAPTTAESASSASS
jgi:hypothetical protein